jgi:hypothetical protein
MRLAKQWRELERNLPENWADARLRLTAADDEQALRSAYLLGPINPARRGRTLRFGVARRGGGPSPEMIGRLLARLDAERVAGELELVGSAGAEARTEVAAARASLAEAWTQAVAGFPPDWSDVYAEVLLVSTDWLERAALLMSPVNPARFDDRPAFRFRVARRSGYGGSAEMLRRSLERVDEAGIRGELQILRVLSDTEHVATQGPVWYVGGRSV